MLLSALVLSFDGAHRWKVTSLRRPIALSSLAAAAIHILQQVTVEKARADSIFYRRWEGSTTAAALRLALSVPADPADAVRVPMTGPGKRR